MKIKGRVSQIIERKDFHAYAIYDFDDLKQIDINYVVVLWKEDVPLNVFKRIWYSILHKSRDYVFPIAMNNFNNKLDDIVEIDVKKDYEESDFYIQDENNN